MLQAHEFNSGEKGISLLILGAVHGNEVAGPLACKRLIEEIETGGVKIISGILRLIPICNPKAHAEDVRQIDENLNRVIKNWPHPKTYEQALAGEIAARIDGSDYVLDIHSTHNAGDVPFAFLDYPMDGNKKIVDALDVDYILVGWPEVYGNQQDIENLSTEAYAHLRGKNGVTLESGYHKDIAAIDLAYNSIINLLRKLKMIEGADRVREKKFVRMTDIVIKAKEGLLLQNFRHLDFLKQGTIVAKYADGQELKAQKDCFIIIPNHEAKVGVEWYYLGELI